jgi:hypothetical protein
VGEGATLCFLEILPPEIPGPVVPTLDRDVRSEEIAPGARA